VNITHTTVRLAATTAVLAGAAVFTAAPSYAGPAPEAPTTTASVGPSSTQVSKAQTEHDELIAGSPGMAAQVQAKIEAMERAQQDPQPAAKSGTGSSGSSDPSSVPVTVLVLLGGGLVAGAAGFTVYRFRHHGRVGAATV
jgi:hypothetical protein